MRIDVAGAVLWMSTSALPLATPAAAAAGRAAGGAGRIAPDCATLDALIAQFGTPDENAQELLSSISPEQLQTYQKQYRRRCILAAALAILLICCAALAYCQRMIQSSIAYATEHITILPTTDLSGTAPEQETSEPEPEPAPDADGKQLPLQTLTPQLQTLYESFTAGRAEPIDETKPIFFFADDFDGDEVEDLLILFETKQEDPDVRDANVTSFPATATGATRSHWQPDTAGPFPTP